MNVTPKAKSNFPIVDLKRLRKFKPTTILEEEEVRLLAMAVREFLGDRVAEMADAHGASFEDNVRFGSVQASCVERRESLRRSIREVSHELQVPQYRLKDIESCRVKQIEPSVLARYVSYLGIGSWFQRWCNMNAELSSRLGVGSARDETSKKTRRK